MLDLGANDGEYSLLAAEHAEYVVAVDGDEKVVDRLYRRLRADGRENILPLVMNLVDPSGGIGWRNRERAPFAERVRPDVTLALALVHHLAIGANVPLAEVVAWLASFGRARGGRVRPPRRRAGEAPAGQQARRACSTTTGATPSRSCWPSTSPSTGSETLPGGTRTLYLAEPKAA